MALNDILKAIDEKVESQIAEIKERSDKELLDLEKDYSEKFKQKQKGFEQSFEKELEGKMLEIQKNFELKKMFTIQDEKRKAVENAFIMASEKISKSGEKKLKDFLFKMVDMLPHTKGSVKAGKLSYPILKGIIKNKEIDIKDGLSEEGFMFSSEIVDIDFRISQVLCQNKEKFEMGVLKALFG